MNKLFSSNFLSENSERDKLIIFRGLTLDNINSIKKNIFKGKNKKIKSFYNLENKIKKNINKEIFNIETKLDNDDTKPIFMIEENGSKKIIYCTNNEVYKYYTENECYPDNLKCCYCGRTVKNVFGIPVLKCKFKDSENTLYYIYKVMDSLECAYTVYINNHSNDPLFSESARLFKEINLLINNSTEISIVKNPDLLIDNGGSIDEEKYNNDSIDFKIIGFKFAPVKMLYYV